MIIIREIKNEFIIFFRENAFKKIEPVHPIY